MTENIGTTIGVPYEIILIDNSKNLYNIFNAYNQGVNKSIYPYLCFMHDDILYQTNNWGELIYRHLNDENTGAIGLAGSPYMPFMPATWWGSGLVYDYVIHKMAQTYGSVPEKHDVDFTIIKNEVKVLDGVWFCIRKKLFEQISFDDLNYTGFHFYDLDTCMQIHQSGYKIYCVNDIAIYHFSNGNINNNWYENALIFQKKWSDILPVSSFKLKYSVRCGAELKALNEFVFLSFVRLNLGKQVYRLALKLSIKYYRIYFYYKTPINIAKYFIKSF